jgi:small conductance mechanosensitive channel
MDDLIRIMWRDLLNPATATGMFFYGVVVLAIAFVAARVFRGIAHGALRRDASGRLDHGVAGFLIQLGQLGIFLFAAILYVHLVPSLRAFGTALLAGASVVSVILGLAAQNTLGNLIAGIAILLYRPFRVGERLQVNTPAGPDTGTVENITLGYTILQTFDNRRLVVPNSAIATQLTVNLSSVDPKVMAQVPVGIAYTADIDRARQILLALAAEYPGVLEVHDCPVTQLGDSSVRLTLRVWCRDSGTAREFTYMVLEQAVKRFAASGVEIPYPYQNVVLKSEPAAA